MKILPLSYSILLPFAPTITTIIRNYLQISCQGIYLRNSLELDLNATKAFTKIPIQRVVTARFQYVSQIADQLAAKLGLTPLAVCENLVAEMGIHQLRSIEPPNNLDPLTQLEMQWWWDESAYLYFRITPRAMSVWLNYLQDLPVDRLPRDFAQTGATTKQHRLPSEIVLYAHARCCSVLRLAIREKSIACDANWQLVDPQWLICDRDHCNNSPTIDRILVFEVEAEIGLIHALMDVLDGIYADRLPNWRKLALNLAESWLEFDRYCRIFGDIQRQNPRLAIARCGLTVISRRYLQLLIENYLGGIAPTEL